MPDHLSNGGPTTDPSHLTATEYRLLVEHSPVMIWRADLSKRCDYFNRVWLEFTGRTLAEEVGDGWAEAVHPDDLERCIDIYVSNFDRRLPFEMEYRLRRWDGEYRWLFDRGVPYTDDHGEFLGYIGSCIDITERREAEAGSRELAVKLAAHAAAEEKNAELRAEEERFRTLANAIPQLAWMTDASGQVQWFNQRWYDYTGENPEHPEIGEWLRLCHSDHAQRVREGLRSTVTNAEPWEDTFPLRGADGRYRWFLTRAVPITGDGGAVTGWLGTSTDVTERLEAEQALQESEERLRRAFEIETVGIIYFTTQGEITGANDAFLQMGGYTREDLTTGRLRWDHLTPPEWMPHSLRAVEEFTTTGRTTPYEKEYFRKDGGRWWALFAATRLNEREGVEFVVDITEQKRAEALAAEQKRLLEQVVRGMPLDALLLDIARFVERYSQDALCSILLLDGGCLHHGAAPSLPEAYCAALDGAPIGPTAGTCGTAAYRGEPVLVTDIETDPLWKEFRHVALPHGLRACWASPITNAGGKVLGTVAMYYRTPRSPTPSDRTLTEIATSIAALVIERAQIERERETLLASERQTRMQAERAARMRDEVLGIVAHDLRNPLGSIVNAAAILSHPVPEEKRTRYLEIVRRAASGSTRLINDLLDVTSIEAGTLAVHQTRIELGRLLAETLEQFEQQVLANGLILETDLPANLPPVFADGGRIAQVVSNLMGNALKFTPAGGRISLRVSSEEGGVRVSLANTGEGIPVEHLPHVFDRFWQAERASRGGAGLGLAISQGIIRAHQGRIWVESAAGCGATFHFTVPCLPTGHAGDGGAPAGVTRNADRSTPVAPVHRLAGAKDTTRSHGD